MLPVALLIVIGIVGIITASLIITTFYSVIKNIYCRKRLTPMNKREEGIEILVNICMC